MRHGEQHCLGHCPAGADCLGHLLILFVADIVAIFIVQMDRLVGLLETPAFTFLRLHLLQPGQHPALLQCAPFAELFV